ncbi:DUF533 domain-containing protein [Tabrizicola sp.]|uniref:DUF533 domain-containing protein n=1 Tax=Tabrizicola sp. TaxID=2005166 RepID=UPI002FDD9A87
MGIGKTLLKVAIGVVIAKGVASLTKGSSGSSGTSTAGRGTRIDTGSKGGLEDMMGDILRSGRSSGGRRSGGGQSGGGLGDLLEQLSGQKRQTPRATAPKGGLDDLLGELTGRGRTTGQARTEAPARRQGGGVGDLLDQVLADKPGGAATGTRPLTLPEPEREEELSAALMLRAVIQAVKCDGVLDDDERARLMQAMGEADQREVQAVQAELNRPVDVAGLARSVPAGLEPQIYMVSLMAIDLDQKAEAEYLHQLAGALDLSPDQVNAIHDKAGAPRLYR